MLSNSIKFLSDYLFMVPIYMFNLTKRNPLWISFSFLLSIILYTKIIKNNQKVLTKNYHRLLTLYI